jgi:exoribonuclease R
VLGGTATHLVNRVGRVQVSAEAGAAMRDGLDRIRERHEIPDGFPADVDAAAEVAAERSPGAEHVDRTDRHFATLDPASSIDLDQAFAVEVGGDDIILHYAIADVGWFVRPGDPLDREAFRRAVTVYLPDRRATLYPPVLSEGAASLLPDGDRPAVVFTVRVAPDGSTSLDGVERALVRSRAKLAYGTVTRDDLPDGFEELSRRIESAEIARGAPRVEFPEQEIEHAGDGRFRLRIRPRLPAEEQNAALSLATNLAVARALYEAGTGLFRTMPDVDEGDERRLRHSARAFGLDWPAEMTLDAFERSLPREDPRTSAFLIAVRRAAGGAGYEPFRADQRPWHGAIRATYAQATAPLRRLQDRYVVEAALAVANGRGVPDAIAAGFEELPGAMARGEQRANRAEREALELAEAVTLSGREGDVFDAVVIDEGDWGVEIQIADPAVITRISARRVDPGDDVGVRLVSVDLDEPAVHFERVS